MLNEKIISNEYIFPLNTRSWGEFELSFAKQWLCAHFDSECTI